MSCSHTTWKYIIFRQSSIWRNLTNNVSSSSHRWSLLSLVSFVSQSVGLFHDDENSLYVLVSKGFNRLYQVLGDKIYQIPLLSSSSKNYMVLSCNSYLTKWSNITKSGRNPACIVIQMCKRNRLLCILWENLC